MTNNRKTNFLFFHLFVHQKSPLSLARFEGKCEIEQSALILLLLITIEDNFASNY